ncbi:MAG: asparagine synthase (glutamine-hydrolyzing) [Rhodospirillales bacterium]|nr:asparagine synthase (glutamine-hydrolyzing) [Rhodospirillales bacterium]
MCGIAGIFNYQGSEDSLTHTCQQMTRALVHRGPDDEGIWVDAAAGVALGQRRLAIIDLSVEGHQPMSSACGRYVITFNGEIYNFQNIRQTLEMGGWSFRGHSDTEVLLAAISAWGIEEALKRSNGMFALALWDSQEKAVYLARDRVGQKPLYYGVAAGALVFGSELKAITGFPGFSPEVNRDVLSLFMRHGYIPDPYAIWQGFHKLKPGAALKIDASALSNPDLPEPVPYWNLEKTSTTPPSTTSDPLAVEEQLDSLLRDAVKKCMVSDVPIGAFLSGGIDSSLVVALMQSQSPSPVHTFSIGFHEDTYNEAQHARKVAEHLGTHHTELYVTERDALDVIPSLATMYDEPFADSSQIPTHLVSKLAREHVTVSLSGDGGDELFCGYNRYVWGQNFSSAIGRVPHSLRRAASAAISAVPVGLWDSLMHAAPARFSYRQMGDKLHKLAGILDAESPEVAYWRLTSLWRNPDLIVRNGTEPMTRLSEQSSWPKARSFEEQMMLLDIMVYLPGDILTKVDRAAMAVGLETRVPLLDHRVIEFAQGLPLEIKLKAGVGKWILRRVLDRYIPSTLIDRPKMGFGVPIDRWLRTNLKEWAEDLLTEERLTREGYFNAGPIRQMWCEHLSGRRNWQHQLWAVLMAQEWLSTSRHPARKS